MGKAANKRKEQGFYRPNGAAARTKPTTGYDDRPKRPAAPTRLKPVLDGTWLQAQIARLTGGKS